LKDLIGQIFHHQDTRSCIGFQAFYHLEILIPNIQNSFVYQFKEFNEILKHAWIATGVGHPVKTKQHIKFLDNLDLSNLEFIFCHVNKETSILLIAYNYVEMYLLIRHEYLYVVLIILIVSPSVIVLIIPLLPIFIT